MKPKKNKKWNVSAAIGISIHTDVMAPTAREAIKIAKERGMQSFCAQCSYGEPEEEWVAGELDGEPENISAEETTGPPFDE